MNDETFRIYSVEQAGYHKYEQFHHVIRVNLAHGDGGFNNILIAYSKFTLIEKSMLTATRIWEFL